jgi:hypothetical protein
VIVYSAGRPARYRATIAAALYKAYSENGGVAELQQVGPYSDDGHRLFFGAGGSEIWGPIVARYLAGRPAEQTITNEP